MGIHTGVLAMPRRLDPQLGLCAVVVDLQSRLRTGVRIPNQGYMGVFGFPTGAKPACLESQPGHPASCNFGHDQATDIHESSLI